MTLAAVRDAAIRAAVALAQSSQAGSEGNQTEGGKRSGLDLTFVNKPTVRYISVLFSVVCCIISFSDLREHLSRFDYPKLQVLEMRIILMIPLYAVLSALSLLFPSWQFFFGTARDTYESFVLYMFFMLMIAYCGGEGQLLRSLKRKRYKGAHPFPMCWLPSFPLDTDFYLRCKRWVLQCALIKPVCSFIAMVTWPAGVYHEGNFSLNNVYTYTCIIVNISLTMALYYLVLFEIECEKELHYARTFLKFLCIKSIIFFSYWQSVVISLASMAHLLNLGGDDETQEMTSSTIQNVLMCIELLPVAFMHRAAFGRDKLDEEMASVPVYMKESSGGGNFRSNVDTALNVNDIIDDTIGTIFYRRGKLVDQENVDELGSDEAVEGKATTTTMAGHGGNGTSGGGGSIEAGVAGGGGGGGAATLRGKEGGDGEALMRDPTLDELVRHAIATDYGVRVDGLLHYDEDSDREERNRDMHYADTDVILRRSRFQTATDAVRVDTDLLRSSQVTNAATPQIYCVVCGRFDREMVRRRNGYKCRECVGTKSQALLRHRQREALAGDDGVADGIEGGAGRHGVGRAESLVIEDSEVTRTTTPTATSALRGPPPAARPSSSVVVNTTQPVVEAPSDESSAETQSNAGEV